MSDDEVLNRRFDSEAEMGRRRLLIGLGTTTAEDECTSADALSGLAPPETSRANGRASRMEMEFFISAKRTLLLLGWV